MSDLRQAFPGAQLQRRKGSLVLYRGVLGSANCGEPDVIRRLQSVRPTTEVFAVLGGQIAPIGRKRQLIQVPNCFAEINLTRFARIRMHTSIDSVEENLSVDGA